MQRIEERTEGAWRPGPGTMYPLLKSLVSEGLARSSGSGDRPGTKTYLITQKGKKDLAEMQRHLSGMGRKEPVMGRLFADLLPGSVYVPMVVRRYRDGTNTFREKVQEIPQPERAAMLKELKLFMEGQIEWIDSQLAKRESHSHTND